MDLQETLNRYFYNQTINELRLMNESASDLTISYNSLLYLDIISCMPQCTVSALASALHVSKSAVTMKIGELAAQGLIVKTQSSEDKRIFHLTLSPEAGEIYKFYDAALYRAVQKAQSTYTPAELDTFCRILNDIGAAYIEKTASSKLLAP